MQNLGMQHYACVRGYAVLTCCSFRGGCSLGFRGGLRCGFRGGGRCGFRDGGNARLFNQTHQRLRLIAPRGLGARRAVNTAPPAPEERDALTPERGLTRFFACIKARDFSRRNFHVNLTGARVAFGAGNGFAPSKLRGYVFILKKNKSISRRA